MLGHGLSPSDRPVCNPTQGYPTFFDGLVHLPDKVIEIYVMNDQVFQWSFPFKVCIPVDGLGHLDVHRKPDTRIHLLTDVS